MKLSFVFPGQGSQQVGMCKDYYKKHENVFGGLFAEANEILGFDLKELCFHGPADELTATEVAQPAILTASVGVYRVLQQEGIKPDFTAGHSVGQFAALVAADVLDYAEALQIVRKRGEEMASVKTPGGMVAVVTLSVELMDEVQAIAKAQDVDIAGHNAPNQLVLSGHYEHMKRLQVELDDLIGVKAKMLTVSQAFHSRLMGEMEDEYMAFVESFHFRDAKIPVVLNCSAEATQDAQVILEDLRKQCTQAVQWVATIERLVSLGTEAFLEVGTSKVLSGLNRAFSGEWKTYTTETPMSLAKTLKMLEKNK